MGFLYPGIEAQNREPTRKRFLLKGSACRQRPKVELRDSMAPDPDLAKGPCLFLVPLDLHFRLWTNLDRHFLDFKIGGFNAIHFLG